MRVLPPLGEGHVALTAQDHVRVLEARAGEAKLTQPMIERAPPLVPDPGPPKLAANCGI